MAEKAFALKESVKDTFGGASAAVGFSGRTLDIGGLLEAGNGFIVTDDPQEIDVLDQHPALKHASVPEGKAAVGEEPQAEKAEADAGPKASGEIIGTIVSPTKTKAAKPAAIDTGGDADKGGEG